MDHLDENTVLDLVGGHLPADAITAIEEHAADCTTCLKLIARAAADAPQKASATAMLIGGYRVLDVIGAGGMGVVYHALTRDDRAVALKTVHVSSRTALASLRREIHALSGLHHPGVVEILDHGFDDGRPFYVMELVEGTTLERLLVTRRSAPSDRDPRRLADVIGVLCELARTLAYLHGRGFVHRDLTPRNVVVRPSGEPVLVDFGLALYEPRPARDMLDLDALFCGTPAYMAPEQIRCEPLDARADLYAFGCILYQAATGHLPFEDTKVKVAIRHLNDAPAPPSMLVGDLPPALEGIILRLLEKRPRDRIGYAEDVAAMLAPFADPAPSRASRTPAPRPYVYRPELVGRTEVLAVLDEPITRALEGRSGRVFLAGESGAGKTRVLNEVGKRALIRGLRVITGSGAAGGRASALQLFRPLLRSIAITCEGSRALSDRLVGPRGKVLAAFEPDLGKLPGQSMIPEPRALTARAARERLLRAVKGTLEALCATSPALLLLDDLQWADELSLDVLDLLQKEPIAGLSMIGAYRSEEVRDHLAAITSEPSASRVALGRLDDAAIAQMAAGMLACERPPRALIDKLVTTADGSPFFVTEYLRAAVDGGWITRDASAPGAWRIDGAALDALPSSLGELIERRLSALSPQARGLFEAASILDHEPQSGLVLATAALDEGVGMDAIEELVARALLEEAGGDRLRAVHAKLREAAHDKLPERDRRALHRRAAQLIEAQPDLVAGASIHAELGRHWLEAGDLSRALDAVERAGEEALGRAAHAEATAWFDRAIAIAASIEAGGEAVPQSRIARYERLLSEAHCALGRIDDSGDHAALALAALGHALPSSRAGWALSLASELGEQIKELARSNLTGALRDPARDPRAREDLREAALAASRVAYRSYFDEKALELVAASLAAVNFAERSGGEGLVALPYAQLGYLAGALGFGGVSSVYFDRARRSADPAAGSPGLAEVLVHEALLHASEGRFAPAMATLDRALDEAAIARDTQQRESAWIIQTHVLLCAGALEPARLAAERLYTSATTRANTQHRIFGLFAIARALIRQGRCDEARPLLDDARALLRERPDDLLSKGVCFGLSALAERDRDPSAALSLANAAMETIEARRPSALSLVDSFENAAEVYLLLRRTAQREGRSVPAAIMKRCEAAGAGLLQSALVFPISQPRWLLYLGRDQALRGRARIAEKALFAARHRARTLGMPYEADEAERRLSDLM